MWICNGFQGWVPVWAHRVPVTLEVEMLRIVRQECRAWSSIHNPRVVPAGIRHSAQYTIYSTHTKRRLLSQSLQLAANSHEELAVLRGYQKRWSDCLRELWAAIGAKIETF